MAGQAFAYDPLTVGKIFYVNPDGTKYFRYDLGPATTTYYVSAGYWAALIEKPILLPGDGSFSDCRKANSHCSDLDGVDAAREERIYKSRTE